MPENFLKTTDKNILLVLALGTVGTLGIVDWLLGHEISFSLFYLGPIAVVAWYGSRTRALLVSAGAAAAWFAADFFAQHNYSHRLIPIWNGGVRFGFFALSAYLIDQKSRAFQKEETSADTDELTGALNYRGFAERAEAELSRLRRYRHPFTLAYIDLDNFKAVNDSKGHAEGDRLLKKVVDVLKTNVRQHDLAARLGGDEFAVLLPETGENGAREALGKLRGMLLAEMGKRGWPVTFSIGVMTFLKAPSDLRRMIKLADGLMYSIKKGTKNDLKHQVWAGDKKGQFHENE